MENDLLSKFIPNAEKLSKLDENKKKKKKIKKKKAKPKKKEEESPINIEEKGEESREGLDTNDKLNKSIENLSMGTTESQNIQSQFMNFNEMNIEELIKPYQEKIEKLEKEIKDKDLEITQLKFKLMQNNNRNKDTVQFMNNNMNQNMMYQMTPFNYNMMNTPMNQFNYNMMNTLMNPFNYNMNQMSHNNIQEKENMKIGHNYNNEKEPKFLTIIVKTEDGKDVHLQCKSDDKMEHIIKMFCCKAAYEKENYEFYVIGRMGMKKAEEHSTVEDNGIQGINDHILVIKKKLEDINNDNNNTNIVNSNIINNNKDENNLEILGKPIFLSFENSGKKVVIQIGSNNTFKDAVKKYLLKMGLSDEENLIFLCDGKKIVDDQMKLEKIGIRNNCHITVIKDSEVIGA